ncbi:hypothetical protein ACLOJK_026415 [Asimina triloba]
MAQEAIEFKMLMRFESLQRVMVNLTTYVMKIEERRASQDRRVKVMVSKNAIYLKKDKDTKPAEETLIHVIGKIDTYEDSTPAILSRKVTEVPKVQRRLDGNLQRQETDAIVQGQDTVETQARGKVAAQGRAADAGGQMASHRKQASEGGQDHVSDTRHIMGGHIGESRSTTAQSRATVWRGSPKKKEIGRMLKLFTNNVIFFWGRQHND